MSQTGSGKTFTITGGPARYEDRGLLPRALAMVFEEMRQAKGGVQYQVRSVNGTNGKGCLCGNLTAVFDLADAVC